MLSCGEDGQVFVWGVRPPVAAAKLPREALWERLGADQAEVRRRINTLIEAVKRSPNHEEVRQSRAA